MKGFIINCAGAKVPAAEAGFTSRCAIGNTDDYLKSFKGDIIPEIVSLGEPASISIVIPSCASAEQQLHQTLRSLCLQECSAPVEILVFINEPREAPERVRTVNERNEALVRSIMEGRSKGQGTAALRCVRQVLCGGLAGAYQASMASMVARLRAFCDAKSIGWERPQKVAFIEQCLRERMILFCDDDMEIKDAGAVSRAYDHVLKNDAVVLGRLRITHARTDPKYSSILRDLMQLFFEFKYDHGLNFLTPRGMQFKNILRVGGVKVGEPFADQVFFASAAMGKEQYLMDAATSIGESDHPGNGNFLKNLRLYLEGGENGALEIFENVLKRYQEDRHQGRYRPEDIETVLASLRTRDPEKISSVVSGMLQDFFID
jgi:hypothetical protein